MIKLIIFDYDGVIVDSFANVHKVYQIMCRKLGKQCPKSIETFRKIYGSTFFECRQNLGINPGDYEEAEEIFKKEILKQKPKLFDGIKDALKMLSKSYRLVLVSATYKEEVINKLRRFNIARHFSSIVARETTKVHLRKSQAVLNVIKKQKVKKDEVILIGDRDIDYEVGKKAGLKNIILVEYGWGYHKERTPHQKVLVYRPLDLLKAIKEFES